MSGHGWKVGSETWRRKVTFQVAGIHVFVGLHDGYLFCEIAQLAYIAWPGECFYHFNGVVRQPYRGHTVFLGKIRGEFSEQKVYVFPAAAQRRKEYLHRVEPVI